jgi:outer membrane protein OmpA-like peptidoglycan-associated protein
MNKYSNAKFSLEGYTDSTGIAVKNLQLSKDRAGSKKII